MKYDKDSFLAGIAVGKQIKGFWTGGVATVSTGGEPGGLLSDITVKSQRTTYVQKPAEGFYGIGSVTVIGDENLVPENIRKGVTILDVVGAYSPPEPEVKEFKLQTKNITVTENGSTTVSADSGYDGLRQVRITTNVPLTPTYVDAKLQRKTVTPGTSDKVVKPDTGYDGLESVTVYGSAELRPENIKGGVTIFGITGTFQEIRTQHKSVIPGVGTQNVYPSSGYDALSYVTVSGDQELIGPNIREGVEIFGIKGTYSSGTNYQEKTVKPSSRQIRVVPDEGYNALAAVTVETDGNLRADNIANGVTIFGVTGTHRGVMRDITVFPGADEQYIVPGAGYDGFSSITVAPTEGGGETGNTYNEGYQNGYKNGYASRDEEVKKLEADIYNLQQEVKNEYDRGFADGREDVLSSLDQYVNGDEVSY